MAEQDYREKIKKLLALSESNNEHEAKSALLKAKKLMAEHKIAEIDLEDIGKKKVVHIKTKFDCSKRREAWMISLSAIIGQNFCCQSYRKKEYNKQVAREMLMLALKFSDMQSNVSAAELMTSERSLRIALENTEKDFAMDMALATRRASRKRLNSRESMMRPDGDW